MSIRRVVLVTGAGQSKVLRLVSDGATDHAERALKALRMSGFLEEAT